MKQTVNEPRSRYRSSESTRVRIIEAAQRLIAEKGIPAMSYREIAAAAGQSNTSVVQYYFGDKQTLVQAVFEHFSQEFEPARALMFEEAERAGRSGDIRSLLEILFLPYLDITDDKGNHTYAAFVSQYMTNQRPAGLPYPLNREVSPAPTLSKLMTGIYDYLGFLPDFLVRPRLQTAALTFNGSIMRWDSEPPENKAQVPVEIIAADAIDQIAAAIVVPFRAR